MVMRFIFLFLACSLSAQSDKDFYDHIVKFEGYQNQPYVTHGRYHIGVGHLIVGNTDRYRNLSHDQLMEIYQQDFSHAYWAALTEVPNYEEHPPEVRILIVALAFNVGQRGLHDFKRFRAALTKRDYLSAAQELRNSLWSRQVGRFRTEYYARVLTNAAFVIPYP